MERESNAWNGLNAPSGLNAPNVASAPGVVNVPSAPIARVAIAMEIADHGVADETEEGRQSHASRNR